jgi:cytochrome c oxidase cbb3-type subunit 1
MAQQASINKTLTIGEGGTIIAFIALAVFSIIVAAKAWTPEYAFHAYLFAAGSVAVVFVIFNRYFSRDAAPVPQEING